MSKDHYRPRAYVILFIIKFFNAIIITPSIAIIAMHYDHTISKNTPRNKMLLNQYVLKAIQFVAYDLAKLMSAKHFWYFASLNYTSLQMNLYHIQELKYSNVCVYVHAVTRVDLAV